jgi:hypothetical protein
MHDPGGPQRRFQATNTNVELLSTGTSGAINWRAQLCRLIRAKPDISDQELSEAVEEIQKSWIPPSGVSNILSQGILFCYKTLYRIQCKSSSTSSVSLDPPHFVNEDDRSSHLRGGRLIRDIDLHIQSQQGLSFLVFKEYTCCKGGEKQQIIEKDPIPSGEAVCPISGDFCAAFDSLIEKSKRRGIYPKIRVQEDLYRPYPWLFHTRDFIKSKLNSLEEGLRVHLNLFLRYIESDIAREYEEVRRQLLKEEISSDYLEYLFVSD